MTEKELADLWNAQADEHNQWSDLGLDEKLEWATEVAREACAKVCDEIGEQMTRGKHCAAAIRAQRGKK